MHSPGIVEAIVTGSPAAGLDASALFAITLEPGGNMPDPLTTGAVILAAGASRRMGRNKMLLPLEGESLVRRTAGRALRAGLAPVVVVLGHEAERAQAELAGLDVEIAMNPSYTGPTSGSLHRGLERVGPGV